MKCSEHAAKSLNFVELKRIFEFLASLNIEYDQVWVQVLGKESVSLKRGILHHSG